MQAFKEGDIRFLICTDVAARGIDIAGLPYVVNMTLPDRSEDYIHRVGRVGVALPWLCKFPFPYTPATDLGVCWRLLES